MHIFIINWMHLEGHLPSRLLEEEENVTNPILYLYLFIFRFKSSSRTVSITGDQVGCPYFHWIIVCLCFMHFKRATSLIRPMHTQLGFRCRTLFYLTNQQIVKTVKRAELLFVYYWMCLFFFSDDRRFIRGHKVNTHRHVSEMARGVHGMCERMEDWTKHGGRCEVARRNNALHKECINEEKKNKKNVLAFKLKWSPKD